MEDLDTPRVVPVAADDILRTLERFGLTWDGEVVAQSSRIALYDAAFEDLLRRREIYACACSRADLARTASAPALGEEGDSSKEGEGPGRPSPAGSIYPGTCREGLPPGKPARAFRFRTASEREPKRMSLKDIWQPGRARRGPSRLHGATDRASAGARPSNPSLRAPSSRSRARRKEARQERRRAAARHARRDAPQGHPHVRPHGAGAGASGRHAPGDAEGSPGALFPSTHSARASASTGTRTAIGMNARRSHDQWTCHAGESRVNAKDPTSTAV
jgi:hypothetical protein